DNADAINLTGRVCYERKDSAGAETLYRRALELKPDLTDALNNLGNALKDLGRLDEARDVFRQALEKDPNMTGTYVNYADSVKFTAEDPHFKAMEALRDGNTPLSDDDRLHLDFALAKAYADI